MQKLGLKHRLNIMITLLLFVIMFFGARFMLNNARENVRAEIESTANLTLLLLDRELVITSKLEKLDFENKIFNLSALTEIRHLRIEFYNANGQLIDTNQPAESDKLNNTAPRWFFHLMTKIAPNYKSSRKVQFDNQFFGHLVITPDPSYEIDEIWSDTKDLLKLVLIYFVLVNTLVYGAIDSALSPVKKILTALTDLEKGHLDTRLPSFDLPEFLSISDKFNHMVQTLEQSIKRNIGLSRQIINLEEVERKNLARDLHDEIGQSITAIHVDALAIMNVTDITPSTLTSIQKSASAIAEVSQKMMGITHQILEKLRPELIDKLGLKTALEDLVYGWQNKLPSAKCQLNIAGKLNDIPDDIALASYRIIQESFTNIAKYSKAKNISVGIIQDKDNLAILIEDDGCGFNTHQQNKGYGLVGMSERITGLGGEFELDSEIGNGTRIVARLPLTFQATTK